MNAIEAELGADGFDLVAEDVDGPLDVSRPIRAAAADLVVEDNRTLLRKALERGEVVARVEPGPPCSASSGTAEELRSPTTRNQVR